MNEAMKREMERRNESAAWHHARMKEECQTLTEEQHDVLSWLCEIRHDLHSENRDSIWSNNSSVLEPFDNSSEYPEVNKRLEEVGLNPIDIDSHFFINLPNSTDYEYILSDEERAEKRFQNLLDEINKYIDYLLSSNPKLGAVMQELWKNINNNPDEFKDKRVSHILTEMRKEAIDNVLTSFAEEWCISLDAVSYSAERYESGDTEIPGLNNLKKSADYNKFSETHNDMSKFKYHQAVKKALSDLLTDEIIPIRDDNYRTDEVKN